VLAVALGIAFGSAKLFGVSFASVYFISSGKVEVSVAGKRIKLGPGDFFGEMALISGLPRSANVTALDYSKFATLSRRDFRKFRSRYPDIRDEIVALATQRRE
jgi:monovalent cation:H+ antiporter-2, CPA2 family